MLILPINEQIDKIGSLEIIASEQKCLYYEEFMQSCALKKQ